MKEFKFDYDEENDDLFVYLEGAESTGAVELGNIVVDFDAQGNLAALEILDASVFFSKLISTAIKIAQIESLAIDIVNFRNMEALQLKIIAKGQTYMHTLLVPRIKTSSPALLN
jgi:uncharacterized protein YuzE